MTVETAPWWIALAQRSTVLVLQGASPALLCLFGIDGSDDSPIRRCDRTVRRRSKDSAHPVPEGAAEGRRGSRSLCGSFRSPKGSSSSVRPGEGPGSSDHPQAQSRDRAELSARGLLDRKNDLRPAQAAFARLHRAIAGNSSLSGHGRGRTPGRVPLSSLCPAPSTRPRRSHGLASGWLASLQSPLPNWTPPSNGCGRQPDSNLTQMHRRFLFKESSASFGAPRRESRRSTDRRGW